MCASFYATLFLSLYLLASPIPARSETPSNQTQTSPTNTLVFHCFQDHEPGTLPLTSECGAALSAMPQSFQEGSYRLGRNIHDEFQLPKYYRAGSCEIGVGLRRNILFPAAPALFFMNAANLVSSCSVVQPGSRGAFLNVLRTGGELGIGHYDDIMISVHTVQRAAGEDAEGLGGSNGTAVELFNGAVNGTGSAVDTS